MPVRGLTADDFTVLEDGQPRPIAAFAPVELPGRELPSAPWMAEIAPDVQTNEFPREGRLVVILLDRSITFGQSAAARSVAEAAVRELRPGDLAAVTYSLYGVPQNFTADRRRLLHAINQPFAGLPDGQTWSPAECRCGVCSLDAIRHVAEAVEHVRQRRKILLYIGSTISIQSIGPCAGDHQVARERALRAAEVSNLTVHTFDPAGLEPPTGGAADRGSPVQSGAASLRRRGNLMFFPDHTGGRAIFHNFPDESLPDVFRESSAYYLLGFQPAHADGRLHRITVRTSRRDVTVQARRGYYATGRRRTGAAAPPPGVPPNLFAAVAGLWPETQVPLRLAAAPMAMPGMRSAALLVTLGVRQEPPPGGGAEPAASGDVVRRPVNVLLGAFDPNGRATTLTRRTLDVSVPRPGAQPVEYELQMRMELRPGRYEIRAAVDDTALGRTGSVYTYVDVPDYFREFVSLSGMFLESDTPGVSVAAEAGRDLLPVVPTARREFSASERVRARVVVYQGVSRASMPGYVLAEILDADNRRVFQQETRVVPADFGANRAMEFTLDLPLARLPPGSYVLGVGVRHGNATDRRDARFSVK